MKKLDNPITNDNLPQIAKLPVKYIIKVKRSISWSERRVEIDKERLRYFKVANNELRFDENIQDCLLTFDVKDKRYLKLVSKQNKFKDVKMFHEDIAVMRKLKSDFDYIQSYRSAIEAIKDKNFIIESETNINENNKSLHETVLESAVNVLVDNVERKLSDVIWRQPQPESAIPTSVREPEHKDTPIIPLSSSYEWLLVQNTKFSTIEYNGNPLDILTILHSLNDEHLYSQFLIKDNLTSYARNTQSLRIKNILTTLFIMSILVISLFMTQSTHVFFITVSVLAISFKCYLRYSSFGHKILNQNLNLPLQNFATDGKMLRISSIFNEKSKTLLMNYIMNFKTYKDWNKYFISISNYNKDDNSYVLNYQEKLCPFHQNSIDLSNTVTLNIHRKITCSDSKVTNVVESLPKGIIKLFVIEQSLISSLKSKITIYLPLKRLLEMKEVPITYLKSALECLDMLQLLVMHQNFYKGIHEENEEDSTVNPVRKIVDDEISVISSLRTAKTMNPSLMPRASEAISCSEIDTTFPVARKESMNENLEHEENPEKTKTNNISTNVANESNPLPIESSNISPAVDEVEPDPAIREENEQLVQLISNKLGELSEFLNKAWKCLDETKEYKLYYYDEPSGLRSIKSEILIDKNIDTVWEYVNDLTNKPKFDKNFDSGNTIREFLGGKYLIQYLKYRGKLLISPRDFTIVTYRKYDANESIIFATSFKNLKKYPLVKGVERADLMYGGYIMKRIENSKTHVIYYTLSDLKLNQTLVNTSLKEVALQVKYLKDLLK